MLGNQPQIRLIVTKVFTLIRKDEKGLNSNQGIYIKRLGINNIAIQIHEYILLSQIHIFKMFFYWINHMSTHFAMYYPFQKLKMILLNHSS